VSDSYQNDRGPQVARQRTLPHVLALLLGIVVAALMPLSQAPAVPALDEPMVYTQPDGTTFVARQGGDEWKNWISSNDALIARGTDGFWYYAGIRAGALVPTAAQVGIDDIPAAAASTLDVPSLGGVAVPAPPLAPAPTPTPAAAPSSPQPTLVLLVQFSDRTLSTTAATWANSFFGTSGKTLRTYYDEVSYSSFYFSAASESQGTSNDGIVIVTLGYPHPNTGGSTDDRNRQIVRDALVAADSYVNFSSFDGDSSGGLSTTELHVVTMVAGYERAYSASYTPNVWGHRWSLFGTVPPPQLDGVYVAGWSYGGGYTQQGELHGTHTATIGILCHELGHDLGLPDLYDTDSSSEGIGGYGVMGSGSWGAGFLEYSGASPTHMSAWSKEYLGFSVPVIIPVDGTYVLNEASSSGYHCLKLTTSDPNQYFLIENRQLSGFDAGLYRWFSTTPGGAAGGGLAIWHIDNSMSSNQDETHKWVDVEEANEGLVGYSELDTKTYRANRYHYYYSGHVTDFDDTTTPNTRLYSGAPTPIDISAVSASASSMTCYISVGVAPVVVAFRVKNLAGTTVALIDKSGNMVLTGTITENGLPAAIPAPQFLVKDIGGAVVATIDTSGNLVLAGYVWENQSSLSPPAGSFLVKNLAGTTVAYISPAGDIYLTGTCTPAP